MRRTILVAAVVPFVSAFLGGALAFSLVAAPHATAQSSQLQEVRASAFTLVREDGTVTARLGPSANGGGRLSRASRTSWAKTLSAPRVCSSGLNKALRGPVGFVGPPPVRPW
jgi:hypothetical protein